MLCQLCGKNEATAHIKTINNGELTEYKLCSGCANKMGYGNLFEDFGLSIGSFLEGVLGRSGSRETQINDVRCKSCGDSFYDIAKSGKVGCADCYSTFYDKLIASIQRIHGDTKHKGKIASSAGREARLSSELESLEGELSRAIEEQRFEDAAKFRDKINELKKQVKDNG